MVGEEAQIVLVDLTKEQMDALPITIIGICKTKSVEELAAIYSMADVFINLTYEDNFPTINVEAIACGTPVVTYNTGGSGEMLDDYSGIIVEQDNLEAVKISILAKKRWDYHMVRKVAAIFNKNDRCMEYMNQIYGCEDV